MKMRREFRFQVVDVTFIADECECLNFWYWNCFKLNVHDIYCTVFLFYLIFGFILRKIRSEIEFPIPRQYGKFNGFYLLIYHFFSFLQGSWGKTFLQLFPAAISYRLFLRLANSVVSLSPKITTIFCPLFSFFSSGGKNGSVDIGALRWTGKQWHYWEKRRGVNFILYLGM